MNVRYLGCNNNVDAYYLEGSSPNGEPIAATLHMRRTDEPIERRCWFNQSKTCRTGSMRISDFDGVFSRVKRICEYARYRTAH